MSTDSSGEARSIDPRPMKSGAQHVGHTTATTAITLVAAWYGLLAVIFAILAVREPTSVVAGAGLVLIAVSMPVAALLALRFRDTAQGGETVELVRVMRQMQRESGLSEAAKRVLHRKDERQLLIAAIEQDIRESDWEAALVLTEELAERFGYRGDAERFRRRIDEARSGAIERSVGEGITRLDALVERQQWPDAYAEAARIQRLHPEAHQARDLRHRIDAARERYRRELERRFLGAADTDSVDEAMSLLKELDAYLTPAEAAPLAEVARGVISKSRENLGLRFKLLVQDHEYAAAVELGQRIIEEFPNTRMAQEVREITPELKQRAAMGGPAGVG